MCFIRKFIIYQIEIVLLTLCVVLFLNNINAVDEKEYLYNLYYKWIIEIPKINLKNQFKVNNIDDKVTGIVMFSNYGRPDIINSNTIIGAHSGTGNDAYFNNLDKLNIGDEIYLNYNNNLYKYEIQSKYYVIETDLSPLNNIPFKTILTLMTCKIGNNKYRLILVGELEV